MGNGHTHKVVCGEADIGTAFFQTKKFVGLPLPLKGDKIVDIKTELALLITARWQCDCRLH